MTDRKFTPPTEFPAEYVTRDGRKAVIHGQMPEPSLFAFFGVVTDAAGGWVSGSWTGHGKATCLGPMDCTSDLQDLPPVRKLWVNVYPTCGSIVISESRSDADCMDFISGRDRIGVIRIEQVEGQMPTFHEEEV
ncbi:MAG: hypothetical protein MRY81_10230 [Donghicola eburneus]|nr:hypothetical protein [Donghicola eburneus]MCI5040049.1 hypothetical protein [Donghicola eburneus]